MIKKIILSTLLLAIFFYFLENSDKIQVKAWKRIFLLFVVLIGITTVLVPEVADWAANTIGIGRGADLLLYTLAIAFFFVTLNIYLKFKEQNLRISKLISQLALLEKEKEDEKCI